MSYVAVTPSDTIIADGAVVTAPCELYAVDLATDGVNQATIILYDNASAASGTELTLPLACAGAAGNLSRNFGSNPVICENGIYANIGGTGASAKIYYRLRPA